MSDAVLSYYAKRSTSGVTKFNAQLAAKLGVPHGVIGLDRYDHPLLSLKASELDPVLRSALKRWPIGAWDVLWHDDGDPEISARASAVYFAQQTGCPSTLQGNASRPGKTILSFGMAHKLQAPLFRRLAELLDGHDYTVCVSAGYHESHPWDRETSETEALLRSIFGARLRFLGFLADDALAREIREAHMVALFYNPGARANNTTVWAAMEAGTPVVTNLDEQSPKELQHQVSVFDIHQLREWPEYDGMRQDVRAGARNALAAYSWDRLVERLTAVHA